MYPAIEPFATGSLEVGDGHALYYEECGNPQGFPVLFVHGGPGAGSHEADRQFFDPDRFRAILFDQRGCGRSKPSGVIKHNTTVDLIGDIVKLRQHLQIRKKWAVFGGSWGSTLALAYAETHPEQVAGMVVRGIWFNTQPDIDWLYRGGAGRFYPEQFEKFVAGKPADVVDPVRWYRERMASHDPEARLTAAKSWAEWESWLLTLVPDTKEIEAYTADQEALEIAQIETHYFLNDGFMFHEILPRAAVLKEIPGTIVQGRYDMMCPPENAWKLHQAWPGSQLAIAQTAGHFGHDPALEPVLVEAMDKLDLGRALEP